MNLHLAFRKMEVTDALKKMIEKKTAKIGRIITYPMDVHVTVSLEKTIHICEIVCHAEYRDVVAVAKTEDLYESIDDAVRKLEVQLKKERDKKKGHAAAHKVVRLADGKEQKDIGENFPHEAKRSRRVSSGE